MTTARRKSDPIAPSLETARPDAGHHSPSENHLSPPNVDAPHRTPLPRNNLSLPRSPLIGRDHEVAVIQQLLLQEQVGLLTLTGPGGIGKTRLALQVAANLLDHFVDGVYFVSLAPISDPELVSTAMAQTLGVQESGSRPLQESLHDYLHDKQLLLVLDNFEQVVTAAPVVGELLSACARLKVLVTSRATLHLYGEQEFPAPPLALPAPKQLTQTDPIASLAHYAAIELFCQRALAAKPDFALTPNNAAAVTEICIKLDGLPLAIELAAARIKLFSPPALLARLNQRLTLLTGGPQDLPSRQRTLRDEIAWSYDLLTNEEQRLFRRLAVFVGGFTLEAVETICSGEWDGREDSSSLFLPSTSLLDLLARLVDKSLVMGEEGQHGVVRYRLLETLREYAGEQLAANNERDPAEKRHAAYYLQLVESAEPQLRGLQAKAWLRQLETEHNNLRAALTWALRMDNADIALRLTGALGLFWCVRGHVREGKTALAKSLSIRVNAPIIVQAKALIVAGLLESILGYNAEAKACFEQGLNLYREVNNIQGIAFALLKLGDFFLGQAAYEQALIFYQQSLAVYEELEDKWGIADCYTTLGYLAIDQGNYEQARMHLVQGLTHQRELGNRSGIAWVLAGLSFIAGQRLDYQQAMAYRKESLVQLRDLEDKLGIAYALNDLGRIALYQGDLVQARTYLAESFILAQELGYPPLMGLALANQGNVAFEEVDYAQAIRFYLQSLEIAQQTYDRSSIATLFERLAGAVGAQKKKKQATKLLGAAANLREVIGIALLPSDQARYQQIIGSARVQLNEIDFAVAWAQGHVMTLEEAITYALTLPVGLTSIPSAVEPSPVMPATPIYPAGLTTREVEVLRLMVQGLAYHEIADKLVISPRTVNAHVRSIFSKLSVTTRAAATRFAIDQHLG